MLHQPTLDKLEAMRLHGMAQAWRDLAKSEQAADLSFEECMALLIDRQFSWRQNEAFEARLRRAKLRANACVEDINYRAARGLDKTLMRSLAAESSWVNRHENVFVCGPTGVGKSYLACALAHKACRDGYSAFYTRSAALFRDLALARADGSLRNFLLRLSKIDVLVVDDWAMTPLSENEARDFWEICEDRCQTRSLVLTSQLPVPKWHSQIGDSTVAEGILDRIIRSKRLAAGTAPERHYHIDVCRGLALFGVLLVNELSMYRVPLLEIHPRARRRTGPVNLLITRPVATILEFEALAILSLLFGAGIAIQSERATAGRASAVRFLARRLVWMALIGVLHMVAIFERGHSGALRVCGLMFLPFLRLSTAGLALG